MTTNTSYNPLTSPPQRPRLEQGEDEVFHDAPPPPPTLDVETIRMIRSELAEMIRNEVGAIRNEVGVITAEMGEIRNEMNGITQTLESSFLRTIENRINANEEQIGDVQLQLDIAREDIVINQERSDHNEQTIHDLAESHATQRVQLLSVRDNLLNEINRNSARHDALLNGTIMELIRRVEDLEAQRTESNPPAGNQLSDLEIRQLRMDRQRDEDEYYLTTIAVVGFSRPRSQRNNRDAAREVLSSIGSEDILHDVSKVLFFGLDTDRRCMRLSFNNSREMNMNYTNMARSVHQIRRNGSIPPLRFWKMLPPWFREKQTRLQQFLWK